MYRMEATAPEQLLDNPAKSKKGNPRTKLMLFISEDWYFWSHRLPIALYAKKLGWDIYLATRVSEHKDRIRRLNIHLIELKHFKRGYQSPLSIVKSLHELVTIYKAVKPDIVHQIALKPIMMGTFAARWVRIPCIVNAFAGMGTLFTGKSLMKNVILKLIRLILRCLFLPNHIRVVFQNHHDLTTMVQANVLKHSQAALIRGSGVDIRKFHPGPDPSGLPAVILPTRMLWEKGVGEFVDAATIINRGKKVARFILVGCPDPENPSSISEVQLEEWNRTGAIEWWGQQMDMPSVYKKAHIVCLPSYREGLPKVLLEAGAAGKPAVTTNTVGCNDIIQNGENGILAKPHDAIDLAEKIRFLLNHPDQRKDMGKRARAVIEESYSDETIIPMLFRLFNRTKVDGGLKS
jgi:glycosyltransferase involved in cell wall biosynthesis